MKFRLENIIINNESQSSQESINDFDCNNYKTV